MPTKDTSRRQFLQVGALATAAIAGAKPAPQTKAETMIGVPFTATQPRMGLIGTGGRGTSLLDNFLAADIPVSALCDIVPEKAQHAQSLVEKAGQKSPELYTKGDHAFEDLVARDDLNLVVIATPWEWHVPMAVAAMRHGKHVATEVPAATSLEECWHL